MSLIKKPMKGPQLYNTDTGKFLAEVPYPVYGTPKLDGIRAIIVDDEALTAKMKHIPNKHIAFELETHCPNGFDGEIITLTDGKPDDFNTIQSKVMSVDGKPEFQYCVFDYVDSSLILPYTERMRQLHNYNAPKFVIKILPALIANSERLLQYEEQCLEKGFEGVMLRVGHGPYKNGRSTLKEFYLVKMKRFLDSEAVILMVNEKEHNENPAFMGELGQTKRRSCKCGLVGADTTGSFTVRDVNMDGEHFGQVFKCGMRLNDGEKKFIWDNRDKFIGKIMTYKYQPSGQKDLPRFPVFYRWRNE